MMLDLIAALGIAVVAFALSGARTTAYLLLFLAYVPFLSPDPLSGGLREVADLSGANVVLKMSLRLATTAGFVALLARRGGALREAVRPATLPVIALVLWALLGLERAHDPWVSLLRLGELFAFFLAGVALYLEAGRHHPPRHVARWHCLALLPLSLAALYFAVSAPELASHAGPGGLRLGHKLLEANVLGFAATATLLWSVHELREGREGARSALAERAFPLGVLALSAAVLIAARSRTAMLAAVAGLLVLLTLAPRRAGRRAQRLLPVALVAVALVWTQGPAIAEWFLRGGSVDELLSGTGRTGLWTALWKEQVPRAPVLGAGYLMLGDEGSFLHAGTRWTNAHNTYLFALVSTGVPGLVAVVAIALMPLVAAWRRARSAPHDERASWTLLLALQVVVVLTSVTGFGISGFPNAVMLYHYAIYLYCVAPRAACARAAPPPPVAAVRAPSVWKLRPAGPVPRGSLREAAR